jgi:alpha-D-xyloside xylohydrolase
MRPARRSSAARGTLPVLAALALAAAAAATAAEGPAVRTAFLAVDLTAQTGAVDLRVLGTDGGVAASAVAPALLLDGERQAGFTATGPAAARNGALDVTLEALGPRAVAVTWTARDGADHQFELQLLSDDETAYYGTGERFNALNQRGYVLPVVTDDRYGNKGVGSYKPVPFFMSSRGFGVWVDTLAPGVLDLSATERFTSKLRFPGSRLRVVLLAGPALADVLAAFTDLTGRPPVPPAWSFALWKSRDIHRSAEEVYEDVERLRAHRIPASVLVIDSPWETGFNTFEVNRTQFPDPEAMFARVRELGFEVALWLTPFVNDRNVEEVPGIDPVSANFAAAAAAGHLVERADGTVALVEWWKGRGGLVDFTDPAAVAWWHGLLDRTRRYGVRAFKVDDGEGNFVPDAVFADGTPARTMKNRYGLLYDGAMQAWVDEALDGDGVLLVRSGTTGMQRYPFAWAGDNRGSFAFDDGLPSVVLAGQNAALSGISLWGSDIAGYAGRPGKEVFIRWTQFATFTPLMQVHGTANLGPWDFDDETLAVFRRFATLRIRLFPYLLETAHEAAATGLPPIRPMALAFQDDPAAAEHVFQYLFGADLLVAPMVQPGTRRSVYLPAGEWVDYWSRERHAGPRTLEVAAPLDEIPLFVRAGAILPLLPEGVETLVRRHAGLSSEVVALDERRVLEVWPGAAGTLRTREGLAAELAGGGGRATLRLVSATPRPLEVRLVGRALPGLRVEGAEVRVDEAGDTLVAFPSFAGVRTLAWPVAAP